MRLRNATREDCQPFGAVGIACYFLGGEVYVVAASDGAILLLLGITVDSWLTMLPTDEIASHRFEFARWCRRNVALFRGIRVDLKHDLNDCTARWAAWLGVNVDTYPVVI